MSSQYGVMDALQREFAQLSDEFGVFSRLAREVLSNDRKIIKQMNTDAAFRTSFGEWLKAVHGVEPASLSAIDRLNLERRFSNQMMEKMKTRSFLQAQDHLRARLQQDMQHLLGRIHHEHLPQDRRDQLVKGVLNLSSNVHSVMSDFNQIINFLNHAQGVHVLQPGSIFQDEDEDDDFGFLPSDFSVPMFSQRVCVMEEISRLQPELESAIDNGDVYSASRLGARVAGLQALLKALAPPPQPRGYCLAITLQ